MHYKSLSYLWVLRNVLFPERACGESAASINGGFSEIDFRLNQLCKSHQVFFSRILFLFLVNSAICLFLQRKIN